MCLSDTIPAKVTHEMIMNALRFEIVFQNLSYSMKSFDDAQEEVHRQEKENKSAAMKAVIKRQRMLEGEKECIEKNPFMELQIETKRFRQDVFKRRHRAKALVSKQDFSTSPMKACT